MIDPEQALQRLRLFLGADDRTILEFEQVLPQQFPVALCVLPNLSVSAVRSWFQIHQLPFPMSLEQQPGRQLHGAIIARRGGAVIFLNGTDDACQRRYSLAHEAGHYFMDHLFPREDLSKRFGARVLEAVDGFRPPTPDERVLAILNRTSLVLHAHLFECDGSDGTGRARAESRADTFALEALAPHRCLLSLLPDLVAHSSEVPRIVHVLETVFHLPHSVAEVYAHRVCCRYGRGLDVRLRLGI